MINTQQKVLVVAAHPDDETLGCGGTLLKHRAQGDEIYWLIITNIQEPEYTKDKVKERSQELENVEKVYNFDKVFNLNLKPMKIDAVPRNELVDRISKVFMQIQPNIVYLPFRNDIHSDHRIIFEAAFSCTKIFRYPFIEKVFMMETLSETEFAPALQEDAFVPNYFVNISEYFNQKIEIMKLYKSEIGQSPFPRSKENIAALATFRGSTAGCKYAEAFVLLREIW